MRRSSRARITQASTATTTQTSNFPLPSPTARADNGATPNLRQDSFHKSNQTRSSSDEDMGSQDRGEPEARRTRQKKRELDVKEEVDGRGDEIMEDEDVEEEDVTRCICRRQEYPGPPIPLGEGGRSSKDNHSAASLATVDGRPEDAGSLFIQCDTCHVWQHGGCVGIMEESMSPENYYCEECRKDLHKIMVGAKGQKYSLYLPVYESKNGKSARRPTSAKDAETRAKEAELRSAASLSSAKRRSTMNSRAALDEEEALRKAIEESKSDGGGSGAVSGNGSRKGKRGREELDESRQDLKRRKTGSESDSPSNGASPPTISDDEQNSKNRGSSGVKRARGAAPQGHRDREVRDRDRERERQRERAEAAGRRKGRAERRRVDESEAPEDVVRGGVVAKAPTARSRVPQPKGPVGVLPGTVPHRKGAKPVRRGRVGRNQYTKDREAIPDMNESPRASNSRDSEDLGNGASDGQVGNLLSNGSKPSKPRHMNPNRTSMNDLRKRAAGILEYISQTQVEIAGERMSPASSSPGARPGLPRRPSAGVASKLGSEVNGGEEHGKAEGGVDETTFTQLSSLHMMDVLTRELVLWQRDHGKFGEK